MILSGTYVAVVTPFDHGKLDEVSLRRVIGFLLDGGVDGLVACGTTGESPTLSAEEWKRVVEIALEESRGKPVIAGTGSNSTLATVEKTRLAKQLGAAGALVVVPYYNKPTQEGLYQHFAAVAEVGLDVVLYNVPSRTSRNLEVSTVNRLAALPNVTAIKEASGSLDAVGAILAANHPGFKVLSGDDSLSLSMYALGAHGVIATTGNVAPKAMSDMYRRFMAGDLEGARRCHYQLRTLFSNLFIETNPAPVKYAMSLMGLVRNELRLPLVPIAQSTQEAVKEALRQAGVL